MIKGSTRIHTVANSIISLSFFTIIMLTSPRTSRVASLTMSSISKKSNNLNIYWFRHQDLRLHDNPALQKCIDDSKKQSNSEGIVPIFCFDPRFVGRTTTTPFGSLKCSVKRAKFILESVQDLRMNLEQNGSGLVVAYGHTEDVMEKICHSMSSIGEDSNELGIQPNLFCQEEIASEEIAVDKAVKRVLKKYKGSFTSTWGSALYDIDDLPDVFNGGVHGIPDTFTPFRTKMEKKCKIGNPIDKPSKTNLSLPINEEIQAVLNGEGKQSIPNCSLSYMPSLQDLGYSNDEIDFATKHDERGVMNFKGGETAALARVQDYIFDKDRLKIYFDTRNGMLGADYSTKFSPWLAHGCLSPRFVAKECKRYEEETGIVNKSTYW